MKWGNNRRRDGVCWCLVWGGKAASLLSDSSCFESILITSKGSYRSRCQYSLRACNVLDPHQMSHRGHFVKCHNSQCQPSHAWRPHSRGQETESLRGESDFSEDTQLVSTEAGIGTQVCLRAEPVLAEFITWRGVLSSGMGTAEMLRGRRAEHVGRGRTRVVLRFRSRRYTEEGRME